MTNSHPPKLPIEDVIDDVRRGLAEGDDLVLEAPPGAGKTTRVPLALLDEPWLGSRKILMLEPRRLATRAAAHWMAHLLNESVGQTVGYRMRLETRSGPMTRIEVITEGIFTRMLQGDPSLEDVALVIFDEFHERNLDSDLGLALAQHGRELFGERKQRLKILVMSATLEGQRLATLLNGAPVVSSVGRQHPVEVLYDRAMQPRERVEERVVAGVHRALAENPESSILVFLPGQGEIERCAETLTRQLAGRERSVTVRPLYGAMPIDAQQRAIEPTGTGARKIVLATNIAETSLTIEGVDVVVDCGLHREPVFDPQTAMTRLQTRRISQASSTQRMGRAGRMRPGRCYRLWSREQQQQLAPHGTPEILATDLAPLALQLIQWGVQSPGELRWLDPPPAGPYAQAIELLTALGAVERAPDQPLRLSWYGAQMCRLAMHPRLAHMLLCAREVGLPDTGALIAAALSDRDPIGRDNPDMGYRLALLTGESSCPQQYRGWLARTRDLAEQYLRQLHQLGLAAPDDWHIEIEQALGYLIASAYPDRIARRRQTGGFQMANGRSANLADRHRLDRAEWLAIAEVGGMARRKGDIIQSAAELDATLFDSLLADLVQEESRAEWDQRAGRFVADQRRSIGQLVIARKAMRDVPPELRQRAVIDVVRQKGLGVLPFNAALQQWLARVNLLRALYPAAGWPDVSERGLLTTLDTWLGPYVGQVSRLADFKRLDLHAILNNLLSWELRRRLDALAPARIEVPSGSKIAIDYQQLPPVLAVKLQEMFGCASTPTVAEGKVALVVHLLSPAGRPLQITQDLAGFWRSTYAEVKKEMKGRYPKHPWPDDPTQAIATRGTKKRGAE